MPHVRPGPSRVCALLLALTLVAVVGTGCGAEPETSAADPGTRTIEVSIEGDTVTPDGQRIAVEAGQPVALVIRSDSEGEVHVHSGHSDEEHDYRYQPGTTTCSFTVDRPGLVDVDLHGPARRLLVQLEVR